MRGYFTGGWANSSVAHGNIYKAAAKIRIQHQATATATRSESV